MNRIEYLKNKLNELNQVLRGSYLNKINEISSLDYVFTFSRSNQSLLITLTSTNPFFRIIDKKFKISLNSLFLNHLKNKLLNSCFIEASLINEDSIVDFKFIKTTDTYDKIEYHLLFELFKGNTNLILLNKNIIELAYRYHSLDTTHPLILNTNYLPPKRIEQFREVDIFGELNKENNYIASLDNIYLNQKYNSLISKLKRKRKSLINKKLSLESDLSKASDNLKYKDYADYYLTIMSEIKKGQSSFIYEGKDISLKSEYSPSDNLKYLYKVYKKAKTAINTTTSFLEETNKEISYLDSILAVKNVYNEEDYEELIAELTSLNILNTKSLKSNKGGVLNKKTKNLKISNNPYFFMYKDMKIGFGKNSYQNNNLTFKIAKKNDTYLHIASEHGSHVIIFNKGNKIDDNILKIALELVLYLSNKNDGTIYVADVKNCKKGSALGSANLLNYETYFYKKQNNEIENLVKNATRFNLD